MNRPLPLNRLAAQLEHLGLGPLVAGLLEAGAGPLGFLAAQGLYLAQPTLGVFVDEARLAGLAEWLDDPQALSALAERLRLGKAAKD
jgi:hypothetical protein